MSLTSKNVLDGVKAILVYPSFLDEKKQLELINRLLYKSDKTEYENEDEIID